LARRSKQLQSRPAFQGAMTQKELEQGGSSLRPRGQSYAVRPSELRLRESIFRDAPKIWRLINMH